MCSVCVRACVRACAIWQARGQPHPQWCQQILPLLTVLLCEIIPIAHNIIAFSQKTSFVLSCIRHIAYLHPQSVYVVLQADHCVWYV